MTGIAVTKNWDGEFVVTVNSDNRDLVNQIHRVVSEDIGLLVKYDLHPDYVDVRKMDTFQHQALFEAAKLYYASNPNKIMTIKFIRSLTATAPLLESKQLVDYACGADKPEWFKTEQANINSESPFSGGF